MKTSKHGFILQIKHIAPAVIVLACSLYVVQFMGRKKALETYPVLQMERLANLGAEVEQTMEIFLQSGVSLHQFAGFDSITDAYLQDSRLHEMRVIDPDGHIVFSNTNENEKASERPESLGVTDGGASFEATLEDACYRVSLNLDSKFETVGQLVLLMPKSLTSQVIEARFSSQTLISGVLIVLFAICLLFLRGKEGKQKIGLILLVYLVFFLSGGWFVGQTLRQLYTDGTQAQTVALAASLSSRFDQIFDMGLSLEDFSEISEEFIISEQDNHEISHIVYVSNNRIQFHSNAEQVGGLWEDSPHHFESRSNLEHAEVNGFIVVGLAKTVIDKRFGEILTQQFGQAVGILILSLLLLWLVDYFLIIGFETLVIPAIFVMSLSFCLLFYVGMGEAYRSFPDLQVEKVAAQGAILKQTMETFLKAGVPLNQFVGFQTASQSILSADPELTSIQVVDTEGRPVFYNGRESGGQTEPGPDLNRSGQADAGASKAVDDAKTYSFSESEGSYRVTLPLHNKFQQTGILVLTIPDSAVSGKINEGFKKLGIWMLVLIIVFAAFVFIDDRYLPNVDYLHIAHGLIFFVASFLVLLTLTRIYSSGIEGKTRALSISVATRLESATVIGLPLDAFSEIDQTFIDYQTSNPELEAVSLLRDGKVLIHTDPLLQGLAWQPGKSSFAYNTNLESSAADGTQTTVLVSIPKNFVYAKLWRSTKNFLVLFIAAALLASLFHTLMNALDDQRKLTTAEPSESMEAAESLDEINLILVKILYFVVVFMEGLFASFLPQYLQQISINNGLEAGSASLLFMAYFAAFAFSLIPAGNYADKHGIKLLMVLGIGLSSVSVYLLTGVTGFYPMMVLRILSGLGQGMILIGVQSFILQVTSRGKTTQGTSIIVFSYNTGMISGTAIGALLVIYMGAVQVFLMGAIIGIFILCFILFLIPDIRKETEHKEKKPLFEAFTQYTRNLRILLEDIQFIKAILLLGISTKATLTGIIVYALPLLMARLAYQQDDIGQVLMFYAGGVLISNIFIPKIVDQLGNTSQILFIGALGSGAGLVLIGLIEQQFITSSFPFLPTLTLILGITILGLAHGLIHAPIVTHIAFTRAAGVLGKSTATSIYRFLERLGHVMGPLIAGYLLVLNEYRAITIVYIGIALALMGVLFFVLKRENGLQYRRE